MPDIVDFPILPLTDRSDPRLISANRSGGMSINGFEQIVSPLSERWRWSVSVSITRPHHARGLRMFLTKARGRLNYVRVRVCDLYRTYRSEMGATPHHVDGQSLPHSDDAYFSDGAGYRYATGTTLLTAAASAGASSLVIDPGFVPIPGTLFSINDWLYVITDVDDPVDLDNPGTERTIHFRPGLREAAAIEDELNFDAVCLWQLATDEEGQATLSGGRRGVATLNFVEPVWR